MDARRILDTVADAQRPSGMLPHHFEGPSAVFTAISGATLPATNLFWLKAALRFVAETGDTAWLERRVSVLSRAGRYLLGMIRSTGAGLPRYYLLNTSGALMIDVFRRGNFTSDANSLAVDVFGEMALMWQFLGNFTEARVYSWVNYAICNSRHFSPAETLVLVYCLLRRMTRDNA